MAVLKVQSRRRAVRFTGFAVLIVVLWSSLSLTAAATRKITEAEVKAAFLYKFGLFTKWPPTAFKSADAPFVIGILGEDPFGTSIDAIAATEKVNGRRIEIVRVAEGGVAPACHILYISLSERSSIREILASIKGSPILTVSDVYPFCRIGGGIRFKKTGNRVSLVVNPQAAAEAGLRISSELFEIAEVRRATERE